MAETSSAGKAEVGVVIISGSCCIPGMAPMDERARRVVEQAIVETGVKARVGMLPATTAMAGGVPQQVFSQLVQKFSQSGQVGLPAILVDGKAVSFGLPEVEKLKAALIQAAEAKTQEEYANE
jgi:hypothetical protein